LSTINLTIGASALGTAAAPVGRSDEALPGDRGDGLTGGRGESVLNVRELIQPFSLLSASGREQGWSHMPAVLDHNGGHRIFAAVAA